MEVIVEKDFWEVFPDAKIGLLQLTGVSNSDDATEEYEQMLAEAQEKARQYIENPDFAQNAIVMQWREAFRKFKTKKGVRASIEALFKRVHSGKGVGTISPLVDIYNAVSLEYGVPCGGEDIHAIQGPMRLTKATGDEEFVTLGSDKSEPPYPGEIVYKDDAGAICRCWNWRESVRTMLTPDTRDAIFVIESADAAGAARVEQALQALKERLTARLGGTATIAMLSREQPSHRF